MAKKLFLGIAVTALLLSLTTLGFAQGSESAVKGSIAAYVTDPSGAVIQGAKATLAGPIGAKTATTEADGAVRFLVLIPGSYSLKLEKQGFKSAEIKSIAVDVGKTSTISVKMEVGSETTVVEVSAAAISVDTTSTSVASNLSVC